jgi:hypothetical protein
MEGGAQAVLPTYASGKEGQVSLLTWVRDRLGRDREARRLAEDDAPADLGTSRRRDSGGVPDPDTQNPNSTTGTTPNATFVGRASGDETGDTGPDGAELRARHDRGGDAQA